VRFWILSAFPTSAQYGGIGYRPRAMHSPRCTLASLAAVLVCFGLGACAGTRGTTPPSETGAYVDSDGDGLPDTRGGADSRTASFVDTDGDGLPDLRVPAGRDPAEFVDTDGDGIPDQWLPRADGAAGTPSGFVDADGDGIPDTRAAGK